MSFFDLLKIEFIKGKRSKIIPLIFIAPLLVVASGIANLQSYFSPEYTNAWAAMFIQSQPLCPFRSKILYPAILSAYGNVCFSCSLCDRRMDRRKKYRHYRSTTDPISIEVVRRFISYYAPQYSDHVGNYDIIY